MAERLTFDNAVEVLLTRIPELRPMYQHLLEQEGPPTDQYNMIANAARFAEGLVPPMPGNSAVEDMVRRLTTVLEEMATSDDPYLPDLMGAGFVEAMNPDAPGFDYLVGLMGPASRAQVESWFGPNSVKHHPSEQGHRELS